MARKPGEKSPLDLTPSGKEFTEKGLLEGEREMARIKEEEEILAGQREMARIKEEEEASDTKDGPDVEEEASAVEVVCVQAVFNRMRNPYTAAVFTTQKVTDVIDLQSKDNSWTRDQINAKVLRIV